MRSLLNKILSSIITSLTIINAFYAPIINAESIDFSLPNTFNFNNDSFGTGDFSGSEEPWRQLDLYVDENTKFMKTSSASGKYSSFNGGANFENNDVLRNQSYWSEATYSDFRNILLDLGDNLESVSNVYMVKQYRVDSNNNLLDIRPDVAILASNNNDFILVDKDKFYSYSSDLDGSSSSCSNSSPCGFDSKLSLLNTYNTNIITYKLNSDNAYEYEFIGQYMKRSFSVKLFYDGENNTYYFGYSDRDFQSFSSIYSYHLMSIAALRDHNYSSPSSSSQYPFGLYVSFPLGYLSYAKSNFTLDQMLTNPKPISDIDYWYKINRSYHKGSAYGNNVYVGKVRSSDYPIIENVTSYIYGAHSGKTFTYIRCLKASIGAVSSNSYNNGSYTLIPGTSIEEYVNGYKPVYNDLSKYSYLYSADADLSDPYFSMTYHQYNITVNNSEYGHIDGDSVGSILHNDSIHFKAVANDEAYKFSQWSDGSTEIERTIIVDTDIQLQAVFVTKNKHSITVTSSPEEAGHFEGDGEYYEGSNVSLNAIPYQGYSFSHWSDGNENSNREFSNLQNDIDLIAYYTEGGLSGKIDAGPIICIVMICAFLMMLKGF